ncbi:MAG: fibrobacter succinogenes major paralogous domain-containing protein [Ignavibacteriae bacterium]|jgi:hypothetical protein|nr:fibrobacter succinogenes major paralogous domain-containing protein [Ignavibacteriota bacterium]
MKTIMRVFCLIIFMQLSVLNFSCQDSSDPIDVPISDNHESITLCNKTVMKMNLNTDKYRDGSSIRHASTNEEWIDANRKKEGAWCYYSGNTQNGSQFGKLYNWYAVTSPKGLAPNGWRIPTDEEFDIIFDCSDFPNQFGTLLGGGRYPDGMYLNLGQIGAWWTSSQVSEEQAKAKGIMGSLGIRLNYTEIKGRGFSVICFKN